MELLLKADGRVAVGGSSLVCHNERLVNPLDPIKREIDAIAKKRGKTEADHLELSRLEFYGGLYTDPAIPSTSQLDGQVIGLPAWNILRCLQDGAKRHKRGADVLRGIYPRAPFVELEYQGPKHPEPAWKAGTFHLTKAIGIQKSRTIRTRPIFTDWSFELPVEVDPTIFDRHTVEVCWADAGRYAGIGEMRPVYGRFHATVVLLDAKPSTRARQAVPA